MDEADVGDAHPAVDRLAHVVDREVGDGDGGQGLHLDAGAARELAGGSDIDGVALRVAAQLDADRAEREGMAERNEIGRALRSHDAGEPRHGEHVALLDAARHDALERRLRHQHAARGGGDTLALGLARDVDHPRPALLVAIREVAHADTLGPLPRLSLGPPAQAGGQGNYSAPALGPRFRGDDAKILEPYALMRSPSSVREACA